MRIVAIVCLVMALVPLGMWAVGGGGMFTQEKRLVETTTVDDFGDEVTTQEWGSCGTGRAGSAAAESIFDWDI